MTIVVYLYNLKEWGWRESWKRVFFVYFSVRKINRFVLHFLSSGNCHETLCIIIQCLFTFWAQSTLINDDE